MGGSWNGGDKREVWAIGEGNVTEHAEQTSCGSRNTILPTLITCWKFGGRIPCCGTMVNSLSLLSAGMGVQSAASEGWASSAMRIRNVIGISEVLERDTSMAVTKPAKYSILTNYRYYRVLLLVVAMNINFPTSL
jgi:hypothetical protein